MEYRNVGRAGLKVSRICLGTNNFGDYVDQETCTRLLDACLEHGINFIDTADVYIEQRSETFLGKAMKGRRHEFIVMTKVFSATGPGVNDRGSSRKHILEGAEASLRRLDTDHIDMYLLHQWDAETPLEETLRAMDDLVRQGKVRYIGCSNFDAWQVCRALWVSDKLGLERFELVQPLYNLAVRLPSYKWLRTHGNKYGSRAIEAELLPFCADQELAVVPYHVLMSGMFSGAYSRGKEPPTGSHIASSYNGPPQASYWTDQYHDLVDRLKEQASQVGCTPPQLALAWALSNPVITSVIAGASKPEQVAQNAKAVDVKITSKQLETVNNL